MSHPAAGITGYPVYSNHMMLWKYSISSEINNFKLITGIFIYARKCWIDVYPCLTSFYAFLPTWWNGTALQGLLQVDWWLSGPGSGGNVNHFQPVNIWYVTDREPLGFLCHRSLGPHAAALPCLINGTSTRPPLILTWIWFQTCLDLTGSEVCKATFSRMKTLYVPEGPCGADQIFMMRDDPVFERLSPTFRVANLYHYLWPVSWGQTGRVSGFLLFFCGFFLVFLHTPSIRALRIIIKGGGGATLQLTNIQSKQPAQLQLQTGWRKKRREESEKSENQSAFKGDF